MSQRTPLALSRTHTHTYTPICARSISQGECAPLDLDAIDIISVDGGDVADLEELDDVVDEDDEAALAANVVLNEVFAGDENDELEVNKSSPCDERALRLQMRMHGRLS